MINNLKLSLWAPTLFIFSLAFISESFSQCAPGLSPYSIVLADESQTSFPTDIAWSITADATGEVIVSQGCLEYTGGTFDFCLVPGESYTFTALDDFGDGWGFPEGSIAWAILYGNGQIAFSGESPTNMEFTDGTEDCVGFEEEFSLTFTAAPPIDCTGTVISVETERNCNQAGFDAIVTIDQVSDEQSLPLVAISAIVNGQVIAGNTVPNLPGQMAMITDLPLDTDIVFSADVLGAFCPSTEVVNVSSDGCVVSLTCGEGFETTYCYKDFDDSEFAYQSPNGEPVSLVFLQGLIEQCCDNIFIYDGPDNNGELLFGGNNNGDLTNVSVTANSGALFMEISSGFLGSCQSGDLGGSEWFWVVGCGEFDIPGCTDPTAFNFNPEATIDDGSCVPFAVNDEACGAILLGCNEEPLTGNFNQSTAGDELDDCVSPFIPSFTDIWFKFESDGTSLYTIFDNIGLNHAVGLYTGDDCENLTEVAICPEENSSFSGNFPAGTYYFLVRPTGGGPFGNFYRVGLTCIPNCNQPFPAVEEESLTTTQIGRKVFADWTPVDGQIGCQVQVREVAGAITSSQIISGEEADGLVIQAAQLQPNTDYEWRVRCGCSQTPLVAGPWSAWQFIGSPIVFAISTHPNPTSGQSFVSFTAVEESYATLEVFDLSGRLVESIFAGNVNSGLDYRFEFDGSALPNGVYLYRLTTNKEVVTEKFMIAR